MSSPFTSILGEILSGGKLERSGAAAAMGLIMEGAATDAQIAAFLAALRLRGETSVELLGFLDAMRERSVALQITDPDAVDLCGTGGDGVGTINVSTFSAFVVAGTGVTVAKHGNRSVSGNSGSADVLRELGVNIELPAGRMQACINETGIGFLFAPAYHPAMKFAARARKDLGLRTCFNLLGPLCTPAGARRQVVGTFDARSAALITETLLDLKPLAAVVVHSEDGLDEVSPGSPTNAAEIRGDKGVRTVSLSPESFGLRNTHSLDSVRGGSPAENASIGLSVLGGEKGPYRDFILLNSALGLQVSTEGLGCVEAYALCAESVDSGRALHKLRSLVEYTNA